MPFSATNQPVETIAYAVQPGDTLTAIIRHYFGPVSPTRRQEIIRAIQAANPAIKNPNYIVPGQLIRLDVPLQYCPIPQQPIYSLEDWFPLMERGWQSASPEERATQAGLAKFMLGAGSAQLATIDRTFKSNAPMLSDMVGNYEAFKRGEISKGQYDYRRRKIVKEFSNRLGPTNLLLNGTRHPNEVLRISRSGGTAPTQPIVQQITKMQRISKVAARGGVALSVVGLGMACHEIAQTDSVEKKNEILVETVGGVIGGAAFGIGAGVAIALMATPVGWVGALVIGVGGALAGYASGKGVKNFYDASGTKIDFAGELGISTVCKQGGKERLNSVPQLSSAALSVL